MSRRAVFYDLPVCRVEPLTQVSVAISVSVPESLRDEFDFKPGQHLTFRDGDVRRSYSICSTPADLRERGIMTVGVKRIPSGVFSSKAQELKPGAVLSVLPPLGHFTTAIDASRAKRYAAIVAGSGITPVLSLAASALAVETASTFTVVCGNRGAAEVMFADALADLKDAYPSRLQLVHVLSREIQPSELLSGRLDSERITSIIKAFGLEDVDEWFLCGPLGVVRSAKEALASAGAEGRVHTELFHAEEVPVAAVVAAGGPSVEVTIVLDGRSTDFAMERGERVLDAALRVRGDLPFACKGGVCSTCRAKVLTGSVEMASNWALEPDEVSAGYVLTCQSTPTSEKLALDYDA
jgi:ring-1,2-phenylacetyl-CoA epoxidase subunit PaaE